MPQLHSPRPVARLPETKNCAPLQAELDRVAQRGRDGIGLRRVAQRGRVGIPEATIQSLLSLTLLASSIRAVIRQFSSIGHISSV